ncbi:MAG: MarC family protein [Pseudomonadota bacterium]
MDVTAYLTAVTTLFVMIDPIGLTPIFVALTGGMSASDRRRIALRSCAIAFGILALFGLTGMALLNAIGITLPAFRIAGGLLLFLIAVDMLFETRTQRREGQEPKTATDPSVFPLATPLIAGPGAIAAMVLLTTEGPEVGWASIATVLAAMASVMACVLALFSVAGVIERALGRTGVLVVTRLLGMLLAALAVQFVLDGLGNLNVLPA